MEITRCPFGHFYDADTHSGCPLCEQKQRQTLAVPIPEPEPPELPLPIILPCGWLVELEGAGKGRSHLIAEGYNTIGSDPMADIFLPDDPQLPPRAAVLGYDDRFGLFSFGPCGGRMPVRVNDRMILDAAVLQPYDILEVGTTRLLFHPLCGSHFRWQTEEKEA